MSAASASASSASSAACDLSRPDFANAIELCSASLQDRSYNVPKLPVERWETAWLDLDELHRAAEQKDETPFLGRRYLIHSVTDDGITMDYQLERIKGPLRWNPVIAVYGSEEEESPCPYTEEWYPPQSINEYDMDALIVVPGICYNCRVVSDRICYECGVGICGTCAPYSGMCPFCVMEHTDYV